MALELAFSTDSCVLDSFCTSLIPHIIKVLICAQDWLCNSRAPINITQEYVINLENLEEDYSYSALSFT